MVQEMILEPGHLGSLLEKRGLELPQGSPLWLFELATLTSQAGQPTVFEGLEMALAALARPAKILCGRRGARRMAPWPFCVACDQQGLAVLAAPEGGGHGRLRFPYSEPVLMDWLVGAFRRFASPEIGFLEFPPLHPGGLSVLLALVDLFRHRYPELDPDWSESEPILFGLPEISACVATALAGSDPSSLYSGLAGLGFAPPPEVSSDDLESLLYLFANEGYLEVDLTHQEPLFRFTEAFVGFPLSLAWWDLSLSLETVLGEPCQAIRLIQGLALWSFESLEDGRVAMKALSGHELEARVRTMVFGRSSEGILGHACPQCGHALAPHAKFCGECGNRLPNERCSNCGHQLEKGAKFCAQCGEKQ
ncbi:zinc ribbon domain-containing protein [bacterium]|nr:zinc ribbon domain-containing protein [bacterium]